MKPCILGRILKGVLCCQHSQRFLFLKKDHYPNRICGRGVCGWTVTRTGVCCVTSRCAGLRCLQTHPHVSTRFQSMAIIACIICYGFCRLRAGPSGVGHLDRHAAAPPGDSGLHHPPAPLFLRGSNTVKYDGMSGDLHFGMLLFCTFSQVSLFGDSCILRGRLDNGALQCVCVCV